jgi:hypothetical protein
MTNNTSNARSHNTLLKQVMKFAQNVTLLAHSLSSPINFKIINAKSDSVL